MKISSKAVKPRFRHFYYFTKKSCFDSRPVSNKSFDIGSHPSWWADDFFRP